jgi:ribosomal protein S12 methylthiotransferase accessory factor
MDAGICPMFAGPAYLRGNLLSLKLDEDEISVRAPISYIKKLFEWCDGTTSLPQLEVKAKSAWGDSEFAAFLNDLLDNGILIDSSKAVLRAARYSSYPSRYGLKASPEAWSKGIAKLPSSLPKSVLVLKQPIKNTFSDILAKRKSCTAFADKPISSEQLSTMLHSAYGKIADGPNSKGHRTVASAGGFYGAKVRVILLRTIEGLSAGVYEAIYADDGTVGLKLVSADINLVPRALLRPDQVLFATGLIVLSADISTATLKYRNRAYSFALMEIGAIAQNFSLIGGELGIAWRTIGGFIDKPLKTLCGLSDTETLMITGLFGRESIEPAGSEAKLELDFLWAEELPQLPFHAARARVIKCGTQSSYSWGRDVNPKKAFDKAIGEATERYAFMECKPDNPLLCCYRDLPNGLHPHRFIKYSPSQYRKAGFPYQPFSEAKQTLWVEAKQVDADDTVMVLADVAYRADTSKSVKPYTKVSSSGMASGPSIKFAILGATLELIERDAFMRHWLSQQSGITVKSSSLPESVRRRIRDLVDLGCEVSIQNLHLGLIPVFMVFVQSHAAHFTCVGTGVSCDDETDQGLISAFNEAEIAARARLAGEPLVPIIAREVIKPKDHSDFYAQKKHYKKADALLKSRDEVNYDDCFIGAHASGNSLQSFMVEKGFPVYWLDMTIKDGPLSFAGADVFTVRALVPGLIPLTFGSNLLPLGMVGFEKYVTRVPHPFS